MKLINDKYRKARGGYSRLLTIYCSKCGTELFDYQKDGPGIIKRIYVDRIRGKRYNEQSIICSSCGNLIASLGVYEKENRPAYNVVLGTISKKIKKIN